MNLSTVALVLAAATAHALWNIASKYKREDTFLFVWAYTCASALLCVPIGIALMVTGQQVLDWRLTLGCAVSAVAGRLRPSRTWGGLFRRPRHGAPADDTVRGSPARGAAHCNRGARRDPHRHRHPRRRRQSIQKREQPYAAGGAVGGRNRCHYRRIHPLGQPLDHLVATGARQLLRRHTPAAKPDPQPHRAATATADPCRPAR